MTLRTLSAHLSRLAAAAALLTACSSDDGTTETQGSSTTDSTSTSDATTTDGGTTATTSTTSTTTDGTATETTGMPDTTTTTGGGGEVCDPKLQDCPQGTKCTATNLLPGDYWNDNRCVPVMGTQGLGESCQIADLNEPGNGLDDCDVGLICLNFDDQGKGYCSEFCNKDDECDSGQGLCIPDINDGLLPICLATCDPLLQDCVAGQGCYGDPAGPPFICFNPDPGESSGMKNAFCEFDNQCLAGFSCVDAAKNAGCTPGDKACCTPYCDLGDPNPQANCDAGEKCVAYFNESYPGYEDVGLCVIP